MKIIAVMCDNDIWHKVMYLFNVTKLQVYTQIIKIHVFKQIYTALSLF